MSSLGVVRRVALLAILPATLAVSVAGADFLDEVRKRAERGDRSGAAAEIQDAIGTLPESDRARATYLLAEYTADWDVASVHYLRVAESFSESPYAAPALIRLGEHELLRADPARALLRFQEAMGRAQAPEDEALALFRTGQTLLLLQRPAEARLHFDHLVGSLPPSPLLDQATLALAMCAHQDGDYGTALRIALDLAHRDNSVKCDANFLVARAFLARGEVNLALEYLDGLSATYPDTREAALASVLADSLRAAHTATAEAPETWEEREATLPEEPVLPGVGQPLPRDDAVAAAPAPDTMVIFEGFFYVQLGAFNERVRALSLLTDLRRRKIEDATITGALVGDQRVFRVRVGPFPDRDSAEAAARDLESVTGIAGFVTEES